MSSSITPRAPGTPARVPSATRRRLRDVRRHARRIARAAVPGPGASLRWTKRRLLRPWHVARAAWRATAWFGAPVTEATGAGRLRQFADVAWLGLRLELPAEAWYRLGMFRPATRAVAEAFLHHREHDLLLADLVRRDGGDWTTLDDKRSFDDWASDRGLASAGTVATATEGTVTDDGLAGAGDLVLKPADAGGGRGVVFLAAAAGPDDDPAWIDDDGRRQGLADVHELLASWSREVPVVAQSRLRPHDDLADLGVGLCTVRIVTGRRPGEDRPVTIGAVLAVPAEPGGVDNFTAGGLSAPIDVDRGVLAPASVIATDRATVLHSRHPATDAPIEGRVVPDWEAVVALATDAHVAAGDVACVGWDVAVTERGPVLLEANPRWNGEVSQVHGCPPLGLTPYLDILHDALP